ncbi:sarcosine oxidase subunit gamma [Pseudonocardia sp. HH130630-07]|uniref:sarcosine oxidase subunit gamma n=1 Tax=Pseudonocardia sp. HH130630-07 TaxID=1690815 RepID=UPI000814E982|nr:sarcosine oxidase subunit gamma family protein [Pseudonocardia sp. HH130630-07]ANY10158.1 sarcosine oxidase subunit gamma [Pseudonocardia sp. HH130630-07]
MAEIHPLRPTHPLEALEPAFAALSGPDLAIEIEETGRATDLRLDPGGPARHVVGTVLGAPLPTRANSFTATEDGEIAWLGPDEWLVTSRHSRPHAGEESLRALVVEHGGAAVDVTGQRVALRIRGRLARELLALGCALDLHPQTFPAGSSAQTLLGQAGVLLLALGHGDDYLVHVRSSFAGYLADWLLDAATEFRTPARTGPAVH